MISFVGAGPGAPDLITVRGADRLRAAQVVIWASSLVPEALLQHCGPDVDPHDSAVMTLEDVLAVFAEHDDDTRIVRLHSGDPSLYGAIAEQLDWCRANGRTVEVVPGVTSAAATAAALQRELTVPAVSQSVVFTRLGGRTNASMRPGESVAAFAAAQVTMAVFLSGARPHELQAELRTGYDADTPAVVAVRVTWPDEAIVPTTVEHLAETIEALGATRTVLVLVGEALRDAPVAARSHLYSPAHATAFRLPSRDGSTAGRPSRNRP